MQQNFTFSILLIITSGISLIMGLYMMLLYWNSRGVKGTGYWAAGSLLVGAGLLFWFVPPPESFFAQVMPTLFIATGLYIYLAGIWQFKEKKIRLLLIIGVPALNMVQALIFYFLMPSFRTRILIYSALLILYCMLSVYEMFSLKKDQRYLQHIFSLNGIAFLAYMGVLLIRAVAIIRDPNFEPFKLERTGIILFVISCFSMTSLTFGFVTAVNLKLHRELEGQLRSRTRLQSIIAHDLRGPVGTIMGYLNLLNTEKDIEEEKRQDFMENLEKISHSTFHLLQNLLDWSSSGGTLERIEKENIGMNTLITENIDFFRTLSGFKSIDIDFLGGPQDVIRGNAKMIETVIRNLISNALKFTPENGKVIIATSAQSGKVRLTVKDNGVGMSKEKLKNLNGFEKFNSTTGTEGEPGSGFGLMLCREFVQKNDGSISIESRLGEGTEVIVQFPAAETVG